jgi:hypothetical protein
MFVFKRLPLMPFSGVWAGSPFLWVKYLFINISILFSLHGGLRDGGGGVRGKKSRKESVLCIFNIFCEKTFFVACFSAG